MNRRRFLNSTVVTTVFAAKGLGQGGLPSAGAAPPTGEVASGELSMMPLLAGSAVPAVQRCGKYEGLGLTSVTVLLNFFDELHRRVPENLSGLLPVETALNYARQIAEALEAAHEKVSLA